MTQENKGLLFGFLGVLGFSQSIPATHLAVAYLDPVFVGLGRGLCASVFAALYLWYQRKPLPSPAQFKQLIGVAAGVVFGFPLFLSLAMRTIPASHGAVVVGLLPLATAVMGCLVSGERPSRGFWLTAALGTLLIVSYIYLQSNETPVWGDLILLGAVLSAAFGYAKGADLSKTLGGPHVICWALVISIPLLCVPVAISLTRMTFQAPLGAWLGFAYTCLISQLFAFFLWYRGLAIGGTARVSQIQLTQPFLTMLGAILFLGESVRSSSLYFALAIVAMVVINKRMTVVVRS